MSKKQLKIHSENILPIIKQWLYSDRDIFVRELVSNSCDAIKKLEILRDKGEADLSDEEFSITVSVDKEKKTVVFEDTGIGMEGEEIEKYIAQIAFSGAEEFVEKFKEEKGGEPIIGHFGLGFYSAYMVAEKVEIDSLSYKEGAKPAFWSCDGSSEYEIGEGKRERRGTTVTLYIGEENSEFLEEAKLRQILQRHCSFLPYPIFLGEERINSQEPLWIKPAADCSDEEYKNFYSHLYPMEEPPLFWMHLNVDYPFTLKGVLYFPKVRRDFDLNQNSVKLFCNRVFVSDSCKEVIPNYLAVLRGVIDSPDIPLNVSRSTLQTDRTVRQLAGHISKKVSDALATLYKTDRKRFLECWEDVSFIVKLGILEDEKFYERVKELLVWQNLDGDWTTLEEYLERAKMEKKVIYTLGDDERSQFASLYKEKGVEVLCFNSPLDTHLIHFLEQKLSEVKFQRIDAAAPELLLEKGGEEKGTEAAAFIRNALADKEVEVEAKSLASNALPGFVLFDENQRRMRDFMRAMDPQGKGAGGFSGKPTFVVNSNSPLVQNIQKLESVNPELAKEMSHQLYEMSLLSQKELEPKALQGFIERTAKVLGGLTEEAAKQS